MDSRLQSLLESLGSGQMTELIGRIGPRIFKKTIGGANCTIVEEYKVHSKF